MDEELIKKLGIDMVMIDDIDKVDLAPGEIVVLSISRETIEKGRVEFYLREFDKYGRKDMRGRVLLSFAGYDNDRREVYEIPEIRKWMNRLLTNIPHLFYFLTAENHNLAICFLCIAPVLSSNEGRAYMDKNAGVRLIEKISKSAVAFSKKRKDSSAVQFMVASAIMESTGYDQSNSD